MFIVQHRYRPSHFHPFASSGCMRPSFYVIPNHQRELSECCRSTPTGKSEDKAMVNPEEEERVIYRDRNARAYETADAYRFVFDLPGVKEDDIEIEIDGNILSLKAERKNGRTTIRKHDEKFVIHRAHIDTTEVVSILEDGVLTVTLKKSEEMKPFHVQVVGSDPPSNPDESNGLLLTIDVPGVKASDATVDFKNGYLHVQYKRQNREMSRKYAVNQSNLDLNKLEAFLTDGVLTITAPARPAKRVKLTNKKEELDESGAEKKDNMESVAVDDDNQDKKAAEPDDAKEYEIVVETADEE